MTKSHNALVLAMLASMGAGVGLPAAAQQGGTTITVPEGCREVVVSSSGAVTCAGAAEISPRDSDVIYFTEGAARLDDVALARIGALANVLTTQSMADACILLVGHSDTSGSADANRKISEARAEAVRDVLVSLVPSVRQRIDVAGRGEDAPSSRWPEGDARQRRVEIMARRC